jgi:transmembrane sensor
MSPDLPPDLIAKWVAGCLSPDDQQVLDEWLSADPARATELEELREVWRMAGHAADAEKAAPDSAEEGRWAAVKASIRRAELQGSPTAQTHLPPRPIELPFAPRRNRVLGWAAAAAVLLAAGGTLWLASHHARDASQASPAIRVYTTRRGQRAELRLSDGTRVMLSVASRLSVPSNYGVRNRTLYLEGAAYFDVVHDNRPFSVHAGDIVANDLGTEFSVRAYPEDRHARVVVRAGRVGLRSSRSEDSTTTVLIRGQLGRLDSAGRALTERADTAAEFAWTEGTLVLDGAPLRDALAELGRWFDLDIRLGDSSLGSIPVAATLVNQPTDQALDFLARSLGLQAVRRGQVVVLHRAEAQH